MGCGRSGTTILGFLLGNCENTLDLGEVVDFLKKRGEPNEYGSKTANGIFWSNVKHGVLQEEKEIFDEKKVKRLRRMEYHLFFLLIYSCLFSKDLAKEYSKYINLLYGNIIKNTPEKEFLIDSSKYPGKALLLSLFLNDIDLYILHLARNPIGVINSLTKKTADKKPKNFFLANLYYFTISLYCFLVRLRINTNHYLKIKYENIVQYPQRELNRISNFSGIKVGSVIERIEEKQPLKKGFIFNGNRMRTKKEVYLEVTSKTYDKNIKNLITQIINSIWY